MRMLFLMTVTSAAIIFMFHKLSKDTSKPVKIISDEQSKKLKKLMQPSP